MTTYLQQHKRDQAKNPCFEYTPSQIAAINGEQLCGSGVDHVTFLKQCSKMANGLRPVLVTRKTLNSRREALYDVVFNADGLQVNQVGWPLFTCKQFVIKNPDADLTIVPKW